MYNVVDVWAQTPFLKTLPQTNKLKATTLKESMKLHSERTKYSLISDLPKATMLTVPIALSSTSV